MMLRVGPRLPAPVAPSLPAREVDSVPGRSDARQWPCDLQCAGPSTKVLFSRCPLDRPPHVDSDRTHTPKWFFLQYIAYPTHRTPSSVFGRCSELGAAQPHSLLFFHCHHHHVIRIGYSTASSSGTPAVPRNLVPENLFRLLLSPRSNDM
jgi:hypothetical protein